MDNNLLPKGEQIQNSVLTEDIVKQIKSLYKSGMRQCDVYRKLNLKRHLVNDVCLENTWKHIKI